MASRDAYKGLDSLFVRGVMIRPNEANPPLWVQKLNQFEMAECSADAGAVRTRTMLALRREQSIELESARTAVRKLTRERLLDGIVARRYSRYLSDATARIQSDPDWTERLEMMARTDVSGLPVEEREVILDANRDYINAVNERVDELRAADREALDNDDDAALREAYVDGWIEQRGADEFMREMRAQEIRRAVRMCDAEWDDHASDEMEPVLQAHRHQGCAHEPLYLDVAEVHGLSDTLREAYESALNRVNVPLATAKGSASQQGSSALSRPQSKQEDSTASTQEEMSPEPVGTSA